MPSHQDELSRAVAATEATAQASRRGNKWLSESRTTYFPYRNPRLLRWIVFKVNVEVGHPKAEAPESCTKRAFLRERDDRDETEGDEEDEDGEYRASGFVFPFPHTQLPNRRLLHARHCSIPIPDSRLTAPAKHWGRFYARPPRDDMIMTPFDEWTPRGPLDSGITPFYLDSVFPDGQSELRDEEGEHDGAITPSHHHEEDEHDGVIPAGHNYSSTGRFTRSQIRGEAGGIYAGSVSGSPSLKAHSEADGRSTLGPCSEGGGRSGRNASTRGIDITVTVRRGDSNVTVDLSTTPVTIHVHTDLTVAIDNARYVGYPLVMYMLTAVNLLFALFPLLYRYLSL
ncbi:hypothetical protein NMY22_g19326 [Coprinellus aureogranulatus]|nr:hypothetical protein NMY22_g19326 [Coprinellus aureogranulatus]